MLCPIFIYLPLTQTKEGLTIRITSASTGNKYVLVILDGFSKWTEAIPCRRATAAVITQRLIDLNGKIKIKQFQKGKLNIFFECFRFLNHHQKIFSDDGLKTDSYEIFSDKN